MDRKGLSEEDRILLTRDMSSRIAFGLRVDLDLDKGFIATLNKLDVQPLYDHSNTVKRVYSFVDELDCYFDINRVRPILKKMGNIEQRDLDDYRKYTSNQDATIDDILRMDRLETFEWLTSRFFDFRGLIEKGLAIDEKVYNRMYYYDGEE